MKKVRQAILDDRLLDFRDEFFARYGLFDNDKGF
jgi:queuine tRNA-ribosyltransferase